MQSAALETFIRTAVLVHPQGTYTCNQRDYQYRYYERFALTASRTTTSRQSAIAFRYPYDEYSQNFYRREYYDGPLCATVTTAYSIPTHCGG